MNAHFHLEKHKRTSSVFCIDCGQKFRSNQTGGLRYHRYKEQISRLHWYGGATVLLPGWVIWK
jgi:hypothetical protein